MIKAIPRSQYKIFWVENNGTIFQDPDWLELVMVEGQDAVFYGFFSNGKLTNCFAAVIVKGRFFSHFTLPLLTPHLGWILNFLTDDLIIQTLRKERLDSIYYSVPTDNESWVKLPTHIINLHNDENLLFKNLRQDKQRSIKKGEKMKLKVEYEKNSVRLISLIKKTFERQKRDFSGYQQIEKIVLNYPNCFQVSILDDQLELASLLFVYDKKKCYYLIGGFNTTAENNFAGPFGMWKGILSAKELTLEFFDFEGSMVPSIAEYFKSFGSSYSSYSMFNEKRIMYKILEKII